MLVRMRILYTLLLYLITPLVLLRLLWRSRELADYRRRIGERFGLVPAVPGGVAVWVHAVSVGEALAAAPLIRALIEQHGEGRVWVTSTTPTGSARVREAFGGSLRHSYAPYDLPGAVARFLARVRPQRVVVMETELWPNLFQALRQRRLPLVIANARLSPRSFAGYSRLRRFATDTLACVTEVAAQSAADAERFRALGAPRVGVMGNIKFDVELSAAQLEQGRVLRAQLGTQRLAWIAASTHEGEESAALAAHAELRRRWPNALLILVPRHPQRFDAVARLVERSGLALRRRSQPDADPAGDCAVLLGDSMGEMYMYFAAADIAFVGGSLVPVGGHNVLEPAAVGLPVLFGPQMHNFLAARELLLNCGAAREVEALTLGDVLGELAADAPSRTAMGNAGRAAIDANRGALRRLLQTLHGTAAAGR
jgi:3-deoxy-D-manno-octulosonic-acid transferase